MRYKWCCLVSALWIMIFSTSCSGSLGGNTSRWGDTTASLPDDRVQEIQQWFDDTLDTLVSLQQAGDLRSVQLLVWESSDASVISQWIDLLHDMEVSVAPAEDSWVTLFYSLTFTTDTEEISVGSGFSTSDNLVPPASMGEDFSIRINNYDDIRDRMEALKKKTGVPEGR